MAGHRFLVSASILDSDLSNLSRECRKALKAGSDRIHLDVMDGHFVPNITFGPGIIKRLRQIGKQPFDAHLMISEPGRYMDEFIDAGCDSITFHVEVEEPIGPILEKIRKAGRLAGLAMTVEPGFGGQKFITDAAAKIGPAHEVFRDRPGEPPSRREVHVDGGVNRDTAALCGSLGVDILVVGSTLWKKGHDIEREIRTIKSVAAEAYKNRTKKIDPGVTA